MDTYQVLDLAMKSLQLAVSVMTLLFGGKRD